jgi:hypothetical protein
VTYKNINRERLHYLVVMGMKSHELTNFLQQSQRQLIMVGVKAQNLPTSREGKTALILNLPPKAYPILERWVRNHIHRRQHCPRINSSLLGRT